ncbi:Zn-dependent protease with chaperone function [Oxalobacteraceae bacterium GrIS 2.11]
MISALYFDGIDATAHPVQLGIKEQAIHILGQSIDLLFPIKQVHFNEPFRHASALIELGNGAQCEVAGMEDRLVLQQALDYQPSLVVRWQARWPASLAAIVIMIALLFCAYYWGIPKLTSAIVDRMPISLDAQIGAQMLPVLDRTLFTESRLSDERQAQARAILKKIKEPKMDVRLIFRASKPLGANAIALPGGVIVVTDQMIIDLTEETGDLSGVAANQLAGVLAHEIGHIEHRHTLRALLGNSAVGAVTASLFGDFSTVVATVPAVLVGSAYSRNMESEADSYAIDLLRQRGISPDNMADVFELLREKSAVKDLAKVPAWMRQMTDFAASHPSDAARIQRFRAAGADMKTGQRGR